MHYYMLKFVKPEDQGRVTQQLIGAGRVDRPRVVDERTGIVPPAWWRGDDYASQSGIAAMVTMKRR